MPVGPERMVEGADRSGSAHSGRAMVTAEEVSPSPAQDGPGRKPAPVRGKENCGHPTKLRYDVLGVEGDQARVQLLALSTLKHFAVSLVVVLAGLSGAILGHQIQSVLEILWGATPVRVQVPPWAPDSNIAGSYNNTCFVGSRLRAPGPQQKRFAANIEGLAIAAGHQGRRRA